jgi:hypothetical protein
MLDSKGKDALKRIVMFRNVFVRSQNPHHPHHRYSGAPETFERRTSCCQSKFGRTSAPRRPQAWAPLPIADVEKSADHPAGRSKAIDGAGSLHSGKQYVKARKPPV